MIGYKISANSERRWLRYLENAINTIPISTIHMKAHFYTNLCGLPAKEGFSLERSTWAAIACKSIHQATISRLIHDTLTITCCQKSFSNQFFQHSKLNGKSHVNRDIRSPELIIVVASISLSSCHYPLKTTLFIIGHKKGSNAILFECKRRNKIYV